MKNPPTSFLPIVIIQLVLVFLYMVLHRLLPGPHQGFFWDEPHTQWADWLFWSLTGVTLRLISTAANPSRRSTTPRLRLSQTAGRILRDITISLVVLFLINYLKVQFSGVELNLSEEPVVGVCLAFVFGFYGQVTYKFSTKIVWETLKRVGLNILHRTTGKMDELMDEDTYIQQYIEPKIQPYYLLGASTRSGNHGHQISHKKLVRYKSAKFVGKAGFTLNALRTVFIGDIDPKYLPEIIAHEASHVAQGYLSDSIEQETEAYITGVRVDFEIKNPNTEIPDEPQNEWLKIHKTLSSPEFKDKLKARERSEEKVRKLKEFAPLYGIIPVEQKVGFCDFIEMVRQGGFLLVDALGLRTLFHKLISIIKKNPGGDR